MDYKKFNSQIYVRFDKGDEILTGILDICKKENILSATFSGIGGCGDVTVAAYIPEKHEYLSFKKSCLLEMISLNGNISADSSNNLYAHAHAMFSYLDENNNLQMLGGHLKDATILLTGEVVISPVQNGVIRKVKNEQTGLLVWGFEE